MPRKPTPTEGRWVSRVDTSAGPDACHPWTGHTVGGYGHVRHEGKDIGSHVYAWLREGGPIPQGMHVDHECHNADASCPGGKGCPHRRCCNARHLRLATPQTNVLAGRSPEASALRQASKTHCPQGHEYTSKNTKTQKKGSRLCIECQRKHGREYMRRKRRGD